LLAHCGGGQDKPGCLGPSAKRPGSCFSAPFFSSFFAVFAEFFEPGFVVFLARLYFRAGDFLSSFSHHHYIKVEPAPARGSQIILRVLPMPDTPAQNVDVLRKLSLDPGTERLATKREMIALLERGAQPEPTPTPATENVKKTQTEIATKENSAPVSARAVPIVENSYTAETTHIDLVELAAILDQHKIWVESGGDEGRKAELSGVNLENADLTGV